MSNLVLDRIKEQVKATNAAKVVVEPIVVPKRPVSEPISPEALRTELENLFQIQEEKVTEQIVDINISENNSDVFEFPDLFHFVEWFLIHKEKFNPQQQRPLSSLVEARDLINVGCACTRGQRLKGATNYFQVFWNNNTKNDLIPTVLSITKTKSVKFGDFLQVP